MPLVHIDVDSPDLRRKLPGFEKLPVYYRESRRAGLSSAGYAVMQLGRKYIETEGFGRWPKLHKVTLSRSWRRTAYAVMAPFVRYMLNRRGNRAYFGFGTHADEFQPELERIGKEMQRRRQAKVTSRMRRFFGAGRKNKRSVPGRDFFPIPGRVQRIVKPAREITRGLIAHARRRAFPEFSRSFYRSFNKRFDAI